MTPPTTPPLTANEQEIRMWNMLCHLSALSGYVLPLGTLLGPLLVWQLKKNEFPSVEVHGKAALNFQITVFIAVMLIVGISIPLMLVCVGLFTIFLAIAIGIAGVVFAIIAAIKANNGEEYQYPCSLKLIK